MLKMTCPRCWNKTRPCNRCDSTGSIDDVQLSPNFRFSELVNSTTAQTRGIPNDPNPTEYARLRESLTGLFQPVRDLLGPMKVTSCFRSLALNTAIKGAKNSAHLLGYAMDCQPLRVSLQESMQRLFQSTLKFDQAILELGEHHDRTNDDWLHLGWKHPDTRAQRRQFLVMENGKFRPWKP
jgi:zinc D-Ala-D-Ala carboxypeptidase